MRFLSFLSKIALITILVVTLSGCKSRQDKIMDRAEGIMLQHPDSARALLESIQLEELSSDRMKARYTVLLTEARYKTFEDDTIPGPISKAADYYADDMRNLYRMKAYYYKSNILRNTKKGGEALISLMHSEKTASLRQDSLWLGRIHGSIGRNFANMNNPAASIPWLEMATKELSQIGDDYFISDIILALSMEYYNHALSSDKDRIEFSNKSIEQANILIDIAGRENDPEYLFHAKRQIGKNLIMQGKFDEAKNTFMFMKEKLSLHMEAQDYVNLGELYLRDNDLHMAKVCRIQWKGVIRKDFR